MGRILDGVSDHMKNYDEKRTFVLADEPEPAEDEIIKALKEFGAEVLVNDLPAGSDEATRFYVGCACKAGVVLINYIPVFIASDPGRRRANHFEEAGLPLIGDDIKYRLGATISHRVLTDLFAKRGIKLERTYQLNTGGNTDFLNMLNRHRLASEKESKGRRSSST